MNDTTLLDIAIQVLKDWAYEHKGCDCPASAGECKYHGSVADCSRDDDGVTRCWREYLQNYL